MTDQPNPLYPETTVYTADQARLVRNARMFTYDPVLEKYADLYDTDRDAWSRLPVHAQDASGMYRDLRGYYLAAVNAGAITDQRPRKD